MSKNFKISSIIRFVSSSVWSRRMILFGFLFVQFLDFSTLSAKDWPTYRFDQSRSSRTPEEFHAAKLEVAWSYQSPFPPNPAWYGPAKWDAYARLRGLRSMRNYDPVFHTIIVGRSVYFGSTVDHGVHCLDVRTGKEKWVYLTDGPIRISPTYHKGKLYFGSDDGYVYCIDALLGKLKWKYCPRPNAKKILNNGRIISAWPCRTGVLIQDKTAYFANSLLPWEQSFLCAVDAETGKPDGEGRYIQEFDKQTFEGAMLVAGSRLIAPQGRVAPLLFDRKTGTSLGSLKKGGGGSFVLVTPDSQIFHGPGNKTGWITVSNAESRASIASFPGANEMIVWGNAAFVLRDKELSALNRKSKKEVWKVACDCSLTMLLAGETIFVGGIDKVAAYSVQNGKLLWSRTLDGRVFGLSAAQGGVYASTDTGRIYCFREQKIVASNRVKKNASQEDSLIDDREIPKIDDTGLLHRWVFQSSRIQKNVLENFSGKSHGSVLGPIRFQPVGKTETMVFDGSKNSVMISRDHRRAKLPKRNITAESWVNIDEPSSWGGIVGAMQDNGNDEKGWVLGYVGSKLSFGLAGVDANGRMTYLQSPTDFKLGQWYHVVGTYDGETMKLFVDGKQVSSDSKQKGDIRYPQQTFFEIGAYHDKDEYFRLKGQLREVRIYDRILSADEVGVHFRNHQNDFPVPFSPELGPYFRFTSSTSATASWKTKEATASILEIEEKTIAGEVRKISSSAFTKTHRLKIGNLKRRRSYAITLVQQSAEGETRSAPFEVDTFFNYERKMAQRELRPPSKNGRETLRLLDGIDLNGKGICVVIGNRVVDVCEEIANRSSMRVIGLENDNKHFAVDRQKLHATGQYGQRVALLQNYPELQESLPWEFANVVIVTDELPEKNNPNTISLVKRILRPFDSRAYLKTPASFGKTELATLENLWNTNSHIPYKVSHDEKRQRIRVTSGEPKTAGVWTHQYGLTDNSAFGREELGGISAATQMEVQWIGRPGPRYQPDRNGRKPSPLSVNGRLFVQGLERIIALDAYNGTVLWSLELPDLKRFNLPRDCSNWCADEEYLYLAIENKCWQIDAQSGIIKRMIPVVPAKIKNWMWDWSYIAMVRGKLIGSAVKEGTAYTNYWGNADAGWYDKKTGPVTYKVCSDKLFALDIRTQKPFWTYENGVIINPTITIAKGKVYFLECRHPKVKSLSQRRVGIKELWENRYLVTLDLETGKKLWERLVVSPNNTVVEYLVHSENKLALVSSSANEYRIQTFLDTNGIDDWTQKFQWPKDNHGGHMSRPAIVGGKLYVRPKVFSLSDGTLQKETMPGGGCGTYACSSNAFFFRAGNVTVWSRENGEVTSWHRLRPDCWLSTIPACGLLLSPEGGGGCSCGSWMETSIAFRPMFNRPTGVKK